MDAFWKWLMRANARWVFWSALAALILVIAWWTWKEFSPLEPEAAIPASALKEGPPLVLGFNVLLEEFQTGTTIGVPVQVFIAPEPPRPPSKVDVNPPPSKPENPPDSKPGNVGVTKPPGAQPPPPKPRDTVSLTYRGLFQRPDGRIMALIEDSKSKSRSFYSVSNELFGVKVGVIENEQTVLTLSDGSALPLKLGQPAVFEGGKRAN
jgi:hypothetical protein